MCAKQTDPFHQLAQQQDVDLVTGALLIATEAYPDLDIGVYRDRLEHMASELAQRLENAHPPRQTLEQLNHYLFVEQGFTACAPKNYYDPHNSYLNAVLDRHVGIPITLSTVYMEVGKHLDLDLVGINFPAHFLVKYNGPDPLYIDPFAGGQLLREDELTQRLPIVDGERLPLEAQFLATVPPRHILARMLRNLKQIHMKTGNLQKTLAASEKISWLLPDAADEHRDLGALYYQVGIHDKAIAAFTSCLHLLRDPHQIEQLRQIIQVVEEARRSSLN
jgi:regulator of sirC expression with transglutaminase-like and TPR domain